MLLEKGDVEKARKLCNDALPAAREFDDPERVAALLAVLGGAASQSSDFEQAKASWEEALAYMKRANRPDGIADCSLELARLEIRMGYRKEAEPMLANALDTYRRLGMDFRIKEVEQLLAELSEPVDQMVQSQGHQ